MEHDEREDREREMAMESEREKERQTGLHCEGGLAADIQVNCKRVKAWRKD